MAGVRADRRRVPLRNTRPHRTDRRGTRRHCGPMPLHPHPVARALACALTSAECALRPSQCVGRAGNQPCRAETLRGGCDTYRAERDGELHCASVHRRSARHVHARVFCRGLRLFRKVITRGTIYSMWYPRGTISHAAWYRTLHGCQCNRQSRPTYGGTNR